MKLVDEPLTHYQKYKKTIYANVVKARARQKLERIKLKEQQQVDYEKSIIERYLQSQMNQIKN